MTISPTYGPHPRNFDNATLACRGRRGMSVACGMGPALWLDEFEDEFILGLRRGGRVLFSRGRWVAQEITFLGELESRGFDLLAQECLFDAVQGARFGNARAGAARVIGDHVHRAGLERRVYRLVHLRAIDAEEPEVVIVEHQRHQVELVRSDFGWNRGLEWLHYGDHVGNRWILRAFC